MKALKQAVRTALIDKYATFKGRASRAEYWWFGAFLMTGEAVTYVLDTLTYNALLFGERPGLIGFLYHWAVFLPTVAINVRRLHDLGKSGWWLPVVFIGAIVSFFLSAIYAYSPEHKTQALIVMLLTVVTFSAAVLWLGVKKGTAGDNRYGPDPLGYVQLNNSSLPS